MMGPIVQGAEFTGDGQEETISELSVRFMSASYSLRPESAHSAVQERTVTYDSTDTQSSGRFSLFFISKHTSILSKTTDIVEERCSE